MAASDSWLRTTSTTASPSSASPRELASLAAAHLAHPERFPAGVPTPPPPPTAAWINPPSQASPDGEETHQTRTTVVSFSLTGSAEGAVDYPEDSRDCRIHQIGIPSSAGGGLPPPPSGGAPGKVLTPRSASTAARAKRSASRLGARFLRASSSSFSLRHTRITDHRPFRTAMSA